MNNRFFRSHLTNAQAILLLVAANLVMVGFLISLTNYNHDIGVATQNEIIQLLNNQGNLSSAQRHAIIEEFEHLPAGGLAGQKLLINHSIMTNHLLHEILGNITHNK